MRLSGKIAVVTGAGRGLGKAIALRLAEEGAGVAVVDINGETARCVQKEVGERGVRSLSCCADVSNVSQVKSMVLSVVKELGTVDILVNNAGILHTTAIENITEEEWDRLLAVNLKSVFFTSQQVLPYMKRKRYGRIVNISSSAGRMGGYGNGVGYAASKAGIIGLTMSFARKVAEFGVTVNAVAPGTTETEIIQALSEETKQMLKNLIPMKRLGTPKNVADAVAFLASGEADFITGAVIDVNGGLFMG
jgi:3-oxoacyl-[acyl-carrier protein] reductase